MNCLHFLLQTPNNIYSGHSRRLQYLSSPLPQHRQCRFSLHSIAPTNLFLHPLLHHCCKCKSTWEDSNAESFSPEDENDFEGSDGLDKFIDTFEEYLDSIWILKVFGSYGWFLPFIIISILLASGLKAFLITLALPLGQSTISFAYQKISGTIENRSKRRKFTSKKNPRARRSKTVAGKSSTKQKMGYQTWVPRSDVSADNPNDKGSSSFGGWDEL